MNDYAWICQDMLDYARTSVNMSKSAWMAFLLHVPIVIPCLLEYAFTYFREVYSLNEHETVKLKILQLDWWRNKSSCFCNSKYPAALSWDLKKDQN